MVKSQQNPRRQIISELLNEFPDAPKKTLAKLLHSRHPEEFLTIEKARTSIRYYTGATGSKSRTRLGVIVDDPRPPSTLKIPKGINPVKRPVVITTPGKWLVCSDWHVPYHDERALQACLEFAVNEKCEHLYINGDAIDFYKSSRWCKDPRARNMSHELTQLWEILDQVTPHFAGRKMYKIGNHEDRFTRRIWQATPELAVLKRFDVDQVLEVKERGFETVSSTQHARMNGLNIFHGHELSQGFIAPVNIARGLWLRTNSRALSGHWHRTSTHIETAGISDKTITCFSLGCLCNLTPEYAPVNKWNHGFAIVELTGNEYRVANYVVDRGKVYTAG